MLKAHLAALLRQWDGRLTQELALETAQGLGKVPQRLLPQATAKAVCGFCSTGCSLTVHLRDGEPINLTPTDHYPVNKGKACPKGWEALTPLKASDRATTPYLRDATGHLKPVDWACALQVFKEKFQSIQARYGLDSVAFISTGQIPTEEMALLGALAKFGMGLVHGDGNTRQCMATSAVAYKQAFGFDSPPFTYQDFEESDVIVFIGANPCIAHPIMWERVCLNPHQPQIIVIDPRQTETAMLATHHYALQPKSDLSLLYGVAHLLCQNDWIVPEYIAQHTVGFEEFREFLRDYSPQRVSLETGLPAEKILELATIIHQGQRVSFWWTMGVNQSHQGVRTAQAIINLALMTGNLGRPGTGANSITGQCNAMGSRLFSNTTNLLGGHDFLNPGHREKIAKLLQIPLERIPAQNSWAYDQIIEGIAQGQIKGLWVIATNPAHSWIHQSSLHETLKKLEFLVVQDMYTTTETAQFAHLILPAAAWGEKEGTFINSERRFGVIKKIAKAPGQALADFYIFKLIAQSWGCEAMFREWDSPEAVFQILKRVSAGQPCDITGIENYAMLEAHGGIQWPLPAGQTLESQERRLFAEGRFFHADGRARFCFEAPRRLPEVPNADYPFMLLTGRGTSAQWHTQTRTKKSPVLEKLAPKEIYIEIHPEDAALLGIEPHQWVQVTSPRGTLQARAMLQASVGRGQVFLPMHYETTNQLTFPIVDPYSRQPAYKFSAVRLMPLAGLKPEV